MNKLPITSVNGISTDHAPHLRQTIEPLDFDQTTKRGQGAPLLSPELLDAIEDDLRANEAGVPLHGANGQLVEQYRSALPILIRSYREQIGL